MYQIPKTPTNAHNKFRTLKNQPIKYLLVIAVTWAIMLVKGAHYELHMVTLRMLKLVKLYVMQILNV